MLARSYTRRRVSDESVAVRQRQSQQHCCLFCNYVYNDQKGHNAKRQFRGNLNPDSVHTLIELVFVVIWWAKIKATACCRVLSSRCEAHGDTAALLPTS